MRDLAPLNSALMRSGRVKMRALFFTATTFLLLPASGASALCAKFVCVKAETCHYHVVSSAGPSRNVNLYLGHSIVLSGLGAATSYCDWAGGRCVTQMRPVQSLGYCG
jgi:hypothetical protein